MSWSDFFYPGNPEKREKIIRRSQEIIDLMKNNFHATNSLIKIVNEHLGSSFRPIALDEKATLKENCDLMITRVKEIQDKVQEVDEKLKEKLEPALYEKLKNHSLGSPDFSKVKCALVVVCHVSSAVLVTYLMKNVRILINITSTCAKVAVGVFASLVLGVLIDMVISAIIGAIERDNLEKTLAEYDKALSEFRPASEKYYKTIIEVEILLKDFQKK